MNRITYVIILFYLTLTAITAQNVKEGITLKNYKEKITEKYYLYQKGETKEILDEVLGFVKLNEIEFKVDTLRSRILYLKASNNVLFLNRITDAKKDIDESYQLAKKTNDYLLLGTLCNLKGLVASQMKRYNLSQAYYEEAVTHYKKVNEIIQLVDTYYNLAANTSNGSQWEASIKHAKSFLKVLKKSNKKIEDYSRIYYYLAHCNIKLKNYEEALIYINMFDDFKLGANVYTKTLFNEAYLEYYEAKKEYLLAYKKSDLAIKYRNITRNVLKDKVNSSYAKELALNNNLNEKKNIIINNQKNSLNFGIYGIILLILLIGLFIRFAYINKKKNIKIKKINKYLSKLNSDLESKNKSLAYKKNDIEKLLKLNQQTLFSRVLKISTFNDSIKKINDDIESKLDNVNVNYLLEIKRKLSELISDKESWEEYKAHFENIRPGFFDRLNELAPKLSINDIRHCTYIVSQLKSKEVSQLINISARSVETARYRIKKKVGLHKDDNLYDFLKSI